MCVFVCLARRQHSPPHRQIWACESTGWQCRGPAHLCRSLKAMVSAHTGFGLGLSWRAGPQDGHRSLRHAPGVPGMPGADDPSGVRQNRHMLSIGAMRARQRRASGWIYAAAVLRPPGRCMCWRCSGAAQRCTGRVPRSALLRSSRETDASGTPARAPLVHARTRLAAPESPTMPRRCPQRPHTAVRGRSTRRPPWRGWRGGGGVVVTSSKRSRSACDARRVGYHPITLSPPPAIRAIDRFSPARLPGDGAGERLLCSGARYA